MKVLFIQILLCKSRKQFWQPRHMKLANSPIWFRSNKKVGLKLQFFKKSSKIPLDTQNAFSTTRQRDFCQISKKNESTIVSKKIFCFLKKFLRTYLTQIWQPWRSFSAKKVRKFWDKVRKWVWVYDFLSKKCNLIQNIFLHTQEIKTFSHLCRSIFVASPKFCCTQCKNEFEAFFLKKITVRHSPKMILNL